MAQESRTFELNGCKYKVTQLGALQALKVVHVLGKVLAPSMTVVDVENENAAMETMASRLGDVLGRLSHDELMQIIEVFAGQTMFATPEAPTIMHALSGHVDAHFAGKRLGDMMRWLGECLKLNFSDFLVELQGLMQSGASALGEEKQSSQTTSSG